MMARRKNRLFLSETVLEPWSGEHEKNAVARWTEQPRLAIHPLAGCSFERVPNAQIAQLVEHATENRSVGGSIPPLGTISLLQTIRQNPKIPRK